MENRYTESEYQKDPEALQLYVKDVRILTPHEYETLRNAIPKDKHRTLFDTLLVTGMRYIEVCRLCAYQEWYNQNKILFICLKKLKRSNSKEAKAKAT